MAYTETKVTESVISASRWKRILRWEYLGLLALVIVTMVFHFMAIGHPSTIVWDEVWYVGDARSIISGTGDIRPEHPPLAKLFILAGDYIFNGFRSPETSTGTSSLQVIGSDKDNDKAINVSNASGFSEGNTIRIGTEQMTIVNADTTFNQIIVTRGAGGTPVTSHGEQEPIFIFKDNAVGWRFFSVIFGEIGIVLVYFICRKLKFFWHVALFATFLFAFEDMTFLHSSLALLDVYMVTFMLAAVFFYLRRNYFPCAIFIALSTECKLSGSLIIIALLLHWIIYRRDNWKLLVGSLGAAVFTFVFFLILLDFFITGNIENPLTRIHSLVSSTAANQFTVPKLGISSRPWTWIYPQWVQVFNNSPDEWVQTFNTFPNVPFLIYYQNPQYISFISSTIQILIVPTIGYMVYKTIKGSQAAAFVLFWFLATYLVWIPLDILTNRVTFVYYFLPTTPAICIGLGIAFSDILDRLNSRRAVFSRATPGIKASYLAIVFYLVFHLAIFIVFNPVIPPIIKTWLSPFPTNPTSVSIKPESCVLPATFQAMTSRTFVDRY